MPIDDNNRSSNYKISPVEAAKNQQLGEHFIFWTQKLLFLSFVSNEILQWRIVSCKPRSRKSGNRAI